MHRKGNSNVCVVIPSANRRTLLNSTLLQLSRQTLRPKCVVLVEHLDRQPRKIKPLKVPTNLRNRVIRIKAKFPSAANQRNQGLEYVLSQEKFNCDIIFFHDDDLDIRDDYFERLTTSLRRNKQLIGVSGYALPGQHASYGVTGILKRILGFDSRHGGVVLPNTVNVPFKLNEIDYGELKESDWLYGCAGWKISLIRNLRFQENFIGQSVAEDLIFSMKAGRMGKLAVDTSVCFYHHESKIGRDGHLVFLENWMRNHYVMFKLFPERQFSKLSFRSTSFFMVVSYFARDLRFNRHYLKEILKLILLALGILR